MTGPNQNPIMQLKAAIDRLTSDLKANKDCSARRLLLEYPLVAANEDFAVELIYTEYVIRVEIGESIDIAQYISNYPDHAERLNRLLELDGALWNDEATANFHDQTGDTFRDQPRSTGIQDVQDLNLPGYRVIDVLGRGAMGVVYKALDLELGRYVAIKTLRSDYQHDDISRFRIEAKSVAQLSHPNIVQLYEIEECKGMPCIVQELVAGGSLKQLIAKRELSVRESAELTRKIAEAIHSAHERGIIHRDLKPGNVLLTDTEEPKVTDFGLAKRLDSTDDQTKTGALIGTPSYMAPEQARGQSGMISVRTDVYGVGAILYELLTKTPPFQSTSVWETIACVINDEPTLPRTLRQRLPVDIEVICRKCLEKEPGDRYGSAAELALDLSRFLDGEPIMARPISRMARTWKWVKRHPAVASLISLLATTLLIGLLITGFWWGNRQQTLSQARTEVIRLLAEQSAIVENQPLDDLVTEEQWFEFQTSQNQVRTLIKRISNDDPLREEYEEMADWQADHQRYRDLRAELQRIRLLSLATESEGFRHVTMVDHFANAFVEAGYSHELRAPEDLDRLRPIAFDWLIASIDQWHEHCIDLFETSSPATSWDHLYDIANELDTNDARRTIRDAWIRQDEAELLRTAQTPLNDLPIESAILLARSLQGMGYLDEAIKILDAKSITDSGSIWLHVELTAFYLTQPDADFTSIIQHAQAAAALAPNHAGPMLMLGNAYHNLGQIDKAQEAFEASLAIEPNYLSAQNNLGVIYLRKREFDQAAKILSSILEANPNDLSALSNLGSVLFALREHERAVSIYERLSVHRAEDPEVWYQLGMAHFELGEFRRAIKAWEETLTALNGSSINEFPNIAIPPPTLIELADDFALTAELWEELGIPTPASVAWQDLPRTALILQYQLQYEKALEFHEFMTQIETYEASVPWNIVDQRVKGAICAGLASQGLGKDSESWSEEQRTKFRFQSYDSLASTIDLIEAFEANATAASQDQIDQLIEYLQLVQPSLTLFAFRHVRDTEHLIAMSPDEAERWSQLWKRIRILIQP